METVCKALIDNIYPVFIFFDLDMAWQCMMPKRIRMG